LLGQQGAQVRYADPFVLVLAHEGLCAERVQVEPEVVRQSDTVVILTDHQELDDRLVVQMADLVVDTRDALRDFRVPEERLSRL